MGGYSLMKVLVCGGRDFDDVIMLHETLDKVHQKYDDLFIIHGDAPGADRMAGKWARLNGVHYAAVPALWNFYGNKAGPLRNLAMLQYLEPDAVVAFPGGSGTAHMVSKAIHRNTPVWVVG